MSYKDAPQVLSTLPVNGSVNVSTQMILSVNFSNDLDRNYIQGNFLVADSLDRPVVGVITYNERVLSFKPDQPLEAESLYWMTLIGDENPDDAVISGIRSVLGVPLAGTTKVRFTTAKAHDLPAPIISWPHAGSVLQDVSDFYIEWLPVAGAAKFELVVSMSNTLTPVIWPLPTQPHTMDTISTPISALDGIYYARVRAISSENNAGAWSPIITFNLDRAEIAPIVPEDSTPQDPAVAYLWPAHIEKTWPEANFANVATTLRVVSFTIAGFTLDLGALIDALSVEGAVRMDAWPVDQDPGAAAAQESLTWSIDLVNTRLIAPDTYEVVLLIDAAEVL
jgi:hypothetical protein